MKSRDAILEAYVDLAYEIGVANVTLQKIADKAGVAFGTVRYYFSSDEGEVIHEAAFQNALAHSFIEIEKISARLRAKKNANPVHVYLESMLTWVRDFPAYGSFLIYYYYVSSSKVRTTTNLAEVNARARQKIESLLLESIGLGLYPPAKNLKDAAMVIHSTVIGAGFVAMATGTRVAFETQRELCLSSVDAFLKKR